MKKEVIDPEGQLELLRQKFTQPQIVRLITENIIQHYLVSYPYTRDFEEGLARLKKMCTFLPEKGEEFILEGEELLARAFCHEIDHLGGHLYVEKVEGELHDSPAYNEEDMEYEVEE